MGTSAKRKREKKQDFQKPKLRVGKKKLKAANTTDTSFTAKTIVINKQSISSTPPTPVAAFAHHLSLLTHKSDNQRRESLAYLTSSIVASRKTATLLQPVSVILSKIQPLILDGSSGVRQQLLKLLQALPAEKVSENVEQLLLYTRAGMTHLAADIRSSSLDVLQWLLEIAPQEVVGCPGGWAKTLRCFMGLLGWQEVAAGNWSSARASFGKAANESKILVKQLKVLGSFIRAGIALPSEKTLGPVNEELDFPIWHHRQHLLPTRSHCFQQLNLFGAPREEESQMYEDSEDRQILFHEKAQAAVTVGLDKIKKEGGEVGRAAGLVEKLIADSMDGFEQEAVGPIPFSI